jgi:thioredoxin 1
MKKILLLLFCATLAQAQSTLSPDDFESNLKQSTTAQLIDVRTSDEYQKAHLLNAKNADVKGGNFEQDMNGLDKNKPVFVYCLSGGRSAIAAKKMVEAGFKEVFELKGGFLKWTSAGKGFYRNKEVTAKSDWSKEQFNALIASDKPVLIDFFATWCGPCQQMMPTVKKLKVEYENRATIETIDYDRNKELALSLGVDEIPMLLIYKKNKLVWRGIGLNSEDVIRKVMNENL